MIVTLLFLLLLKKRYTFHSHSKCVMISERARQRASERAWLKKEGQTVCIHICRCMCVCHCACDRELALILLIGVSVRPHTGLWVPMAGRPVTMWKLREEEWGGEYGAFVCGSRHMSACVAIPSSRVWSLGFGEMIVIALVLALKMPF